MISSNARYWIWITQAIGYDTDKINKLYDIYSDIAEFYNGGEREWRLCGIFPDSHLEKLKNTPLAKADEIIARCEELGISAISVDDPAYPKCLLNIYASPAVLYVDGLLPDVDNTITIGIVGTRRASAYGTRNSYKFGYALSKCGVCVVSGGALGIDGAAHRGALKAGGCTVSVLGCGVNYDYPKENADIRREIPRHGALVSEYPPDTPPLAYQFPKRNRIIAALSDGVLIIESGKKSGSLITADYALEMGKELFALLGNNSPQNEGSNARIKEGTAIPVTDYMDVITAFNDVYTVDSEDIFNNLSFADSAYLPVKENNTVRVRKKKEKINVTENTASAGEESLRPSGEPVRGTDAELTGDMKKVYEHLSAEPKHIDILAQELGIPVFKVSTALTSLQIKKLVDAEPGRKFRLK